MRYAILATAPHPPHARNRFVTSGTDPLMTPPMSILEPVRGMRGWKGLISAAKRGDIGAAVSAADQLDHVSEVTG